jgi:HAD superfamily hydrolase (TIGR01450 family)
MKDYRAWLLDLDGVIYRGERALPGARELMEWLDATGRRVMYLSNNSFASPTTVAQKLARLGMPRPEGRVLTAGGAAAQLLARRFPGGRVYALAMPEVAALVAAAGLRVVWQDAADGPPPDAVLVGLDRTLTYDRLARGLRAVLAGAAFIAVNRDPRLPVEDGFEPGTGALVTALEYASGRQAEIVGKPAPGIALEALRELETPPSDALMVGDGVELDIVAASAAGIASALVLTGLTTAEEAQAAAGDRRPTMVFAGLPELLAAAKGAR